MSISFTKLPGLNEAKIVAAVEPILAAHRVEGVELIWRSDQQGWVLELTLEKPESVVTGAGITIDLCSEISRELSVALDAADAIGPAYRLEVGSPGVERALYQVSDYRRFAGQGVKIKLKEAIGDAGPFQGQRVVRGSLFGVDEETRVLLETENGTLSIELGNIESAHLLFDWDTNVRGAGNSRRSTGRGPKSRGARRSK